MSRAAPLIAALVILGSTTLIGCSEARWFATPSDGPSPRGFAATACSDSSMFVYGGALPPSGPVETLVDGAFQLASSVWSEVGDPPIDARTHAVSAATPSGEWLVWGGRDGVVSASNEDEFGTYDDGALYADGVWQVMNPFVASGSYEYNVAATETAFLVLATDPNSQLASMGAVVGLDGTVSRAEVPSGGGVVTGGSRFVHFGSSGVHQLAADRTSWSELADVELDPIVGSGNDELATVTDGPGVWVLDGDILTDLGTAPNVPVESVHLMGDVVVSWNSADASVAFWDTVNGWGDPESAPQRMTDRVGSSVCTTSTDLIVRGGWNDRGTLVASRTGFQLRVNGR